MWVFPRKLVLIILQIIFLTIFLYNFSLAFTNVLDYIVEALAVDIFQSYFNSASFRIEISCFSIGINQILYCDTYMQYIATVEKYNGHILFRCSE